MVNLTGISDFGLSQIDIDGAASKLVHFVNTAGTVAFNGTSTSATTLPLRLRTGGIQVVRHGHGTVMQDRLNTNALNNPSKGQNYCCSFSTRGPYARYRVDIFDVTANKWFSLMARDGTYSIPGATKPSNKSFTLSDEGYMSQSVAPTTRNKTQISTSTKSSFGGMAGASPRPVPARSRPTPPRTTAHMSNQSRTRLARTSP